MIWKQVYQTYDGSGMQQVNGYDFKGNPLSTQVQLLDDRELTDADWAAGAEPDLSPEVFSSSITYDALNRPVTSTDPGGNIQAYTYDKGGMLKTVMLNSVSYVNDIHYDAKGQRQAIWYGNSTKTSYTYDPETFRLRRLLTVNLNNNDILQDLHYWYDPVGNITEIRDDAQQTLFFNNSVVAPTQEFIYDALYRLIAAEGRELIGSNSFGANDNYNDASWQTSHKGDGNAVQRYTQQYTYDAVGNILELSHNAAAGAYTRTYDIATDSNRLLSTTVGRASPPGSDTYVYAYDVRGNMETMPHLSSMGWNLTNELSSIAKGTMAAWYQYSGGQRIRKYVDKGSFKEERIYLGSFEIYRKFDHTSSLIIERTTVHVSDDTGRIAMLETRTEGDAVDDNGTAEELTRYIYSNHLQSASLELDASGAIISYEEYHPYGTTSYQAMNASVNAVAKRYRYTGKERDDESGLYYHGARYYIPWLCRWSAVDPLQNEMPGWSSYNYGFCNPVKWTDLSGAKPGDPPGQKSLIEADNTAVVTVDLYKENDSGALTPDGGRIRFPKGTMITREVTEGGGYTFSIDQEAANLPVGAVLGFSYEGIEFSASFRASDKSFLGYYSEDKSYYITYDKNQLPYKLNTEEASNIFLAGLRWGGTAAVSDGAFPAGDVIGAGASVIFTFAAVGVLLDNPYGGFSISRPQARPFDGPIAIPIAPAIPITDTKPRENNGTIIYRSMKMDDLGFPLVEESARGLGVRVNNDIPVVEGFVSNLTGGMSVAPNDPRNLPPHRRPESLGGTGKDPIFEMNTNNLPPGLTYIPDKPGHGTIQPAFPMPYETYRALLSSTKLLWKPYGK